MQQELLHADVILEEYDLEHHCITLPELRWLLRRCGRHTPYWMYFVLRATTGMRPEEAVKLTLYHLNTDCGTITYRVDKPSTKLLKTQEYQQRRKHRRVVLDPWVQQELIAYLNRTCRVVNGIYVSPYPHQQLFPWKNMSIVGAYWYKLRKQMHKAGFDSLRLVREYKRPTKTNRIYVVRPHILRHLAASIMYYKLGDLASVRDWIKHEDTEITNGYLHSAAALDTTPEYLKNASWAEILGYDEKQTTIPSSHATEQTILDNF